ncbi:xylanase inhibitor protein 1-like [Triticum dicoccoides]|uniref:GH18 domain-containing protein n=1 Tax=Triticum turgidum subsp. durum TaxID=4567 RepID=A0A9R0WQG9_TRITD|nr:xylanase inhibitor protein 1-like [Triticum dicoccoides]VAI20226.1 unnamed protein product [Triticum turgidum subsp. durum]
MALARRSPASSLLVIAAVLSVHGLLPAPAAATGKTGQLTVFWGRNKDEGSLREACDAGLYTAVIMSFLNVYGHGKYRLDLSGHPLAGIGGDIRHCQSMGITVSLSIGGYGGDYALPTNRSALDLADHLWFSYLGGRRRGVRRPFGRASLDGVDLFLERGGPAEHYDALARELARRKARGGKAPRLTATPRYAFPDRLAAPALSTGVFERIHVRFYDYPDCTAFIEDAWGRWTAAYPGSEIHLGLTASEKASCYLHPKALWEITMPIVQKAANYGGVMLWDRYYDVVNVQDHYSSYIKNWA